MAVEFSVDEARERLTELIERAEAGEHVVITRSGAAAVSLEPSRVPAQRREEFAAGVVAASWVAPEAGGSFDVGTDY
ncbi:type II toxin-antitoxin system prevent-host-death family antitoxin [Saccharopolyspora rhizosphaerae]|uniref:Type II toxin-antitoxin system prevent-host-death family antitoxin n=1 Tax=Saccharopolyspora rhizosphaerae TaxID=2492662 RepID=A0A3R8Q3L3_9PSEU|nr:type II toxin-antitoxin system prevent-host-death family antitoxin [Saccharopolyspora rhizosphaerae]RRO16181.1 type II toxin-antitoxin system prevent-host-death family antitoxin [Saccharopolyspora rhizosphaerae]